MSFEFIKKTSQSNLTAGWCSLRSRLRNQRSRVQIPVMSRGFCDEHELWLFIYIIINITYVCTIYVCLSVKSITQVFKDIYFGLGNWDECGNKKKSFFILSTIAIGLKEVQELPIPGPGGWPVAGEQGLPEANEWVPWEMAFTKSKTIDNLSLKQLPILILSTDYIIKHKNKSLTILVIVIFFLLSCGVRNRTKNSTSPFLPWMS
jgi:hypothetical protein